MRYVFKERQPLLPWSEFKKRAHVGSLLPFYFLNWAADWSVGLLAKWPLLELLEYLGSFSILFATIFYFAGASDRLKQKHYQAWQVINSAQGKGGNGGRIDALQELNHDHIRLVGVDVSGAYLQGVRLEGAELRRGNFSSADLREAVFSKANLEDSDFHWANLRGAILSGCDLAGSDFADADLAGASLAEADLDQLSLERADLRDTEMDHVKNWRGIKAITNANIFGIRNAPQGFVDWARKMGAIETQ
jgi:hypothetical protein